MLKSLICGAALVASPLATATAQDTGTNADRIIPDGWQETYDNFHYAPAVRAGDTLYLSGVVATLQGDESEFDPADIERATDRAFDSIAAILSEAGADWSDVVEITTYHTELIHQVGPFTASKDKYMKAPYPAWTAIDVDRLFPERGFVEIKVTAYLGQ